MKRLKNRTAAPLISILIFFFGAISCGEPDCVDIAALTAPYENCWFVSPRGNDAYGGSYEKPFRSVQKAVEAAFAGDAVFIRGGTYEERVLIEKSGRDGKPITIAGFPNERPVLDGTRGLGLGVPNSEGKIDYDKGIVHLTGASYITIKGLTISDSKASGIYCGGVYDEAQTAWVKTSSHIAVEGCTLRDCEASGICFGADYSPSEDIKVINNRVVNCSQRSREAVSLRTVNGFEIAYNVVERVKKESIDVKSGCQNGTIHHNTISGIGAESSSPACGIYLDAGYPSGMQNFGSDGGVQKNIRVHGNVVKEFAHPTGSAAGIAVASEEGNDGSDIYIYNNLVYNTGVRNGAGIKVGLNSLEITGTLKNIFIYNNTVYGTAQQGIYVNYPTVENIAIVNNISVASDVSAVSIKDDVDASKVAIKSNVVGSNATHKGDNAIAVIDAAVEKVLFLNAAKGDFRSAENSPAIGKAYEGTVNGQSCVPDTDIAGSLRPQGSASDIGAYER